MMKTDTLEEFPVPADHARVRGKRTRRQRSAAAAAESRNSFLYSSPDTSSGISTRTEEDEDMANCLILLAHGDSPPEDKLSGRVSTEMATTRAGSVGVYIYECKTCNRTFTSFQALGGHRASHKKPRPSSADDQKKALTPPGAVDQQGGDEKLLGKLSSNKICPTNDQIRPKIHECSICGSEFASGQALGGHMRRHRAAPAIAMDDGILTDVATEKPRSEVVVDFDLNLPAPPEDDKFNQFPGDQQQPMVFSAAALVDCHY